MNIEEAKEQLNRAKIKNFEYLGNRYKGRDADSIKGQVEDILKSTTITDYYDCLNISNQVSLEDKK